MRSFTAFFILSSFLSINTSSNETPAAKDNTPKPWPEEAEVSHIDDQMIHFKAPEGIAPPPPIKTKLQEIQYLGFLNPETPSAAPFLLVSAVPCTDCGTEGERSLYIIKGDGTSYSKHVFPGKIRDQKTNKTVFEARAFFGKCLPRKGDIYVVFQKEKVDRRKYLQKSVYIAEPRKNHIHEQIIVHWKRRPSIKRALSKVKAKKCFEIEGKERKTSTFKLKTITK